MEETSRSLKTTIRALAETVDKQRTDLARLRRERDELREKLPKTLDKVRVVPGVDKVWHPAATMIFDKLAALTVHTGGFAYWYFGGKSWLIAECYSTRAAAEAALAARESEGGIVMEETSKQLKATIRALAETVDKQRTKLARIRKERDELRKIVEKLPKCWRLMDGKLIRNCPVVPKMEVWIQADEPYSVTVHRVEAGGFITVGFEGSTYREVVEYELYDTREAVLAALAAK